MTYQIRQGRLEDVTDIAAVEAACFPTAEAADEKSLKERMTAFPECFFVAEEKTEDGLGRIIGFINGAAVDRSINIFLMRFMILPVNYERSIFQKEIFDLLR